MEACIVVCRSQKPPERQGQTLFIDAINEVSRERATSFLKPEHQQRIVGVYQSFLEATDLTFQEAQSFLEGKYPGFARVANHEEIARQGYSLSIPLYVKRVQHENSNNGDDRPLPELWAAWEQNGREFWQEMDALVEMLDNLTNLPGSYELPGRFLAEGVSDD
jgi:type I restriction enzyme M protein